MSKKVTAAKRRPPVRGRAGEPPRAILEQIGQLVMWRPRASPPGSWLLCLAVGMRFRYGNWDLQLIPITGGGSWWAEQEFVAPAPNAQLEPAKLLTDLELRYQEWEAAHGRQEVVREAVPQGQG